jgi:hypothetical protein
MTDPTDLSLLPSLPVDPMTLALPPDLAAAIEQQHQHSGKPQEEILIDLLRQALSVSPTNSVNQELEELKQRLSLLEALIPRVENLEGKSIAF